MSGRFGGSGSAGFFVVDILSGAWYSYNWNRQVGRADYCICLENRSPIKGPGVRISHLPPKRDYANGRRGLLHSLSGGSIPSSRTILEN